MQSVHTALPCLLDLLRDLTHDQVEPTAARLRLQALNLPTSNLKPQLLWNRDSFGAGWQYELLIPVSNEGAAILTFCPHDGIPWNLRNAYHRHEQDIVRVNNEPFAIRDAMAMLDTLWSEADLITRFVDVILLRQAGRDHEVSVSDEELQAEMNDFRRARGLFSAETMRQWLAANGMEQATLETYLQGEVTARKLRDVIVAPDIETYFAAHRAEFDTVRAARLHVTAEQSETVATNLHRAGRDFYAVAETLFCEEGTNRQVSFVTLTRGKMSAAQAASVFTAEAGQVVGPVPSGRGFDFLKILDSKPAVLNEETRNAVRDRLFTDWLETKRKAAAIEWYWGYAEPQIVSSPQ